MDNYLYIFLLAIVLTIYSVINFFVKELSDASNIKKIRKLWYSLVFLFYSVYIDNLPSDIFKTSSKIGIPQELWILLIHFIAFTTFAVVIDHLIIRTTKLGEIRFGNIGGSISEETTKDIIDEQDNTIDILFDKIKAENEIFEGFSDYTQNLEHELENLTFSYESYIYQPLKMYCDYQKSDIEIVIYDGLIEENLHQLKSHFSLTCSAFKILRNSILNYQTFYCDKQTKTLNYKKDILFIPYKSDYLEDKILIALQSKNDLIVDEQYFIYNILNYFEYYLFISIDMLILKKEDET
ncbi:MAG: hypothetical protein K9L17_10925 [Clostridiales bacterium]|nr:hypothetical protein [Clostridiales bacterium]MCF8023194.1 hypothetical protein [Clostridiales bacterium]